MGLPNYGPSAAAGYSVPAIALSGLGGAILGGAMSPLGTSSQARKNAKKEAKAARDKEKEGQASTVAKILIPLPEVPDRVVQTARCFKSQFNGDELEITGKAARDKEKDAAKAARDKEKDGPESTIAKKRAQLQSSLAKI